jgi:hypothetical protein
VNAVSKGIIPTLPPVCATGAVVVVLEVDGMGALVTVAVVVE